MDGWWMDGWMDGRYHIHHIHHIHHIRISSIAAPEKE